MTAKENSAEPGRVQAVEIQIGPKLADEAHWLRRVTMFHTKLMDALKSASGLYLDCNLACPNGSLQLGMVPLGEVGICHSKPCNGLVEFCALSQIARYHPRVAGFRVPPRKGPSVAIPSNTEEDALRIANRSPYGLTDAVHTGDVALDRRFARNVQAGIVRINDHHRVDAASPWGGIKLSGIGRAFGKEAFNAYVSSKAVMVSTSAAAFDWYDPAAQEAQLN